MKNSFRLIRKILGSATVLINLGLLPTFISYGMWLNVAVAVIGICCGAVTVFYAFYLDWDERYERKD